MKQNFSGKCSSAPRKKFSRSPMILDACPSNFLLISHLISSDAVALINPELLRDGDIVDSRLVLFLENQSSFCTRQKHMVPF